MMTLCSKSCFHFVDEKTETKRFKPVKVIGKRWSRRFESDPSDFEACNSSTSKFVNRF